MGHEYSGELVEVGDEWRSSRRTTASEEPIHACGGRCFQCKNGQTNVCADFEITGFHHDGAFAEYTVVDALERALDDGEISAAGIDVLPQEPPEPTPPFDHDSIVYTPHVAWYSEDSVETLRRTVTEDVFGVVEGEPPRNPVNEFDGS